MRMGTQLVSTGNMDVYRPDREELQSIRNGAWEYDYLIEWAEKADKDIYQLVKQGKCVLPKKAKTKEINKMLMDFHLDFNFSNYTLREL
jgi:hypothetical protein